MTSDQPHHDPSAPSPVVEPGPSAVSVGGVRKAPGLAPSPVVEPGPSAVSVGGVRKAR